MWFVAGLIPLVVGAIYYNPKVFGNSWMKVNNFTPEYAGGGNMAVTYGLAYLFAVMMALIVSGLVIHQTAVLSMMAPAAFESGGAVQQEFNTLMQSYGGNSRGFGHGAFHGFFIALFFALPILGTIALFERRGWKYVLIHLGYWTITIILMGGFLCHILRFAPLS